VDVARCILHVACCTLYVVCCILYVVCCKLYVVCCPLYVAHCMLYVAHCILHYCIGAAWVLMPILAACDFVGELFALAAQWTSQPLTLAFARLIETMSGERRALHSASALHAASCCCVALGVWCIRCCITCRTHSHAPSLCAVALSQSLCVTDELLLRFHQLNGSAGQRVGGASGSSALEAALPALVAITLRVDAAATARAHDSCRWALRASRYPTQRPRHSYVRLCVRGTAAFSKAEIVTTLTRALAAFSCSPPRRSCPVPLQRASARALAPTRTRGALMKCNA